MSEKIISEANLNKSGAYPGWKAKAAADKAAEDAAQAAKTEVEVTQVQGSTNGTKIATIGVDDVDTDIYAPAVAVTQVQGSTGGTKIATVAVGATSTDIYAPASSGAEEFEVNFTVTITNNSDWPSSFTVQSVTADKTPAEVYAAYQAGKKIIPHISYGSGDGNFLPNICSGVYFWSDQGEDYIELTVANFILLDGVLMSNSEDGILFSSVYGNAISNLGWSYDVDGIYNGSGYRYFYDPNA